MSGMSLKYHVLQVRFGSMEEEGKKPFDWANIHVVDDSQPIQIRDDFAGVDLGKLPLDSSDGNRLAKELHAAARAGGVIPGQLELTFTPKISLDGKAKLIVTGWKPVSNASATSVKA